MPGDPPASPAEAARDLLRRGFQPLPLDPKSKGTRRPGWPDFRSSPERVEADFPADGNLGLLLGEVSGGLTDLDLDSEEALRLAPTVLPRTDLVSGRASAPDSHRFYLAPGAPYLKLDDPLRTGSKATLLELRSGTREAAHQTMVPPSVHPSGERVAWSRYGEPATVPADDLERAARELAAASVLLRYLPERDGSQRRHSLFLALSGVLLRSGWEPERAQRFERAIRKAAGDDSNREHAVDSTVKRLDRGATATGWPSFVAVLSETLPGGEADARKVAEWLAATLALPAGNVRVLESAPTPGEWLPVPAEPEWPEPPDEAAFSGIFGDLVRAVAPHTEADPVALLGHALVYFGAEIGRQPRVMVGATAHRGNLFVANVGSTARGAKGTAKAEVEPVFREAGATVLDRVVSGLQSGEAVVHSIRDPKGKDEGEPDKRLILFEAELGRLFKVAGRDGSTVSAVARELWDSPRILQTASKHFGEKATEPHGALLGHITDAELVLRLTNDDISNGFANRFVFISVRASKLLPEGGRVPQAVLQPLAARLRERLDLARTVGEVTRTAEARAAWSAVYPALREERPGLVGALLARAAPQVLRLSLLYALGSGAARIEREHLESALALWSYSERSVRRIFGDLIGDPVADALIRALRAAGAAGLSRSELWVVLGRNGSVSRLERALDTLARLRLARGRIERTGGRPAVRWFAAEHVPAEAPAATEAAA
ncbi:MAG TPA: bifunctional DNA primase/polymerase [Thermoanaerobaculia bacterium]|nr:bifunctional DNA primase/polymerase [Thermoanaerobaculia bacterium]HQP88620.1 bifunctional DNA primase/polymerase [Thermoanaerobaculia bacterium]